MNQGVNKYLQHYSYFYYININRYWYINRRSLRFSLSLSLLLSLSLCVWVCICVCTGILSLLGRHYLNWALQLLYILVLNTVLCFLPKASLKRQSYLCFLHRELVLQACMLCLVSFNIFSKNVNDVQMLQTAALFSGDILVVRKVQELQNVTHVEANTKSLHMLILSHLTFQYIGFIWSNVCLRIFPV
jgi:hypothetical protein